MALPPVSRPSPRPIAPARPANTWWAGRPLSEAKNEHRTNTKEQFQHGLESGANWFEGDVRRELDGSGIEMRHDTQQESGDNLTLREWLTAGKASGRGLKLDIKESREMPTILAELERAQIPQERLMINLGYAAFEKWGPEIRARFPNAILALNPSTDKPLTAADAKRLVDQGKRLGGPVTFVVRHDLLTDAAIAGFKGNGPISVWGHAEDPAATGKALRARGVDGMIDVDGHTTPSVKQIAEYGFNWARTKLTDIF